MDIKTLRDALLSNHLAPFTELYRSFKPYCLATLKSKHKNLDHDDCEAIYDDAIIIFRDNLLANKVVDNGNLKTYITGICLNVANNLLRKNQRYNSKKATIGLLFETQGHTPIEDLEYKETLYLTLQKGLEQLGDKCKNVIVSFYIDQLSMEEIAKKYNFASKDVAKTTKSRCFKKLQAIIASINV